MRKSRYLDKKKNRYRTLLSVTDRFISINDVIEMLQCTDVTARQYVKVLIERDLVEITHRKSPILKGNDAVLIKAYETEITDELLNELHDAKPAKTEKAEGSSTYYAAPDEFGKDGIYRMSTRPSKEIEKKLKESYSLDSAARKTGKQYVSGASLSAVTTSLIL